MFISLSLWISLQCCMFFSLHISISLHLCMCMCLHMVCVYVCVVQGWGWCATPGAIPSFHATWILLEWEVECIQVRWSNKSAGFVSSVWNMNIKHIRIIGGSKYVTSVILSDLLVSLGLRCREDDEYLPERVRHLGDALIQSDSVIVTVKQGNSTPPPHTSSGQWCRLPKGQSVTNMSLCAHM